MDDFVLLLPDKAECITVKEKIENFLATNLHLELNDKSRYYPSKMGVNFCGYRIFPTHRLLRTNSKQKIKNRIKKWNKQYNLRKLNYYETLQSLNSWVAHSSHCNSYHLQKKILNSCNFLLNDSFYSNMEASILDDIQNWKNVT